MKVVIVMVTLSRVCLSLIQDPSRNHKSYRDLITSLRPPLIPFTPLLLKGQTDDIIVDPRSADPQPLRSLRAHVSSPALCVSVAAAPCGRRCNHTDVEKNVSPAEDSEGNTIK